MDESTTLNDFKAQQCRKIAQAKSERKRQAVFEAISLLQRQGIPVTRRSVMRQADVSYPFLNKHLDLLSAIDLAQEGDNAKKLESAAVNQSRNQALAAMQRRLDKLKQQLQDKELELREKQKTIDLLYGKLATSGELTDAELRAKLAETLKRLQAYEGQD